MATPRPFPSPFSLLSLPVLMSRRDNRPSAAKLVMRYTPFLFVLAPGTERRTGSAGVVTGRSPRVAGRFLAMQFVLIREAQTYDD